MYKPIRKADLIKGGTAVKQGEIFTLGFQLFDANGLVIVPTVEQTITVKIANKTGVVYETVASVVGDHIEFTVDENIGAGKMRVELTVADGANVLQKYPASGHIELMITASLDDIGTGTIYTVTAAQMFARIEDSEAASASAVETAGNAVVIAEGAVETADAVRADFDLVVAEAGSSNPEIVLARGGEADLKTRLDKTSQQLAEKATQTDLDATNSNVALKASKSYVDTLTQSIASGSPKGVFATLSALQTAFPTGNTNTYVVTADGKWYFWNGTAWTAGGTYQAIQTNDFLATNHVANGDFSAGTANWNVSGGTFVTASNVLSLTANGTSSAPSINQTTPLTIVPNNKIYIKLSNKVNNPNATSIGIHLKGSTGAPTLFSQLVTTAPSQDVWYTKSGIFSFDATYTGALRITTYSAYADTATANGKIMGVQYVLAIDLTETFGAGKEPTKEEMDEIINKFPNGWFNGAKNLFSLKDAIQKISDTEKKLNESLTNVETTLYNGTVTNNTAVVYNTSEVDKVFLKVKRTYDVTLRVYGQLASGQYTLIPMVNLKTGNGMNFTTNIGDYYIDTRGFNNIKFINTNGYNLSSILIASVYSIQGIPEMPLQIMGGDYNVKPPTPIATPITTVGTLLAVKDGKLYAASGENIKMSNNWGVDGFSTTVGTVTGALEVTRLLLLDNGNAMAWGASNKVYTSTDNLLTWNVVLDMGTTPTHSSFGAKAYKNYVMFGEYGGAINEATKFFISEDYGVTVREIFDINTQPGFEPDGVFKHCHGCAIDPYERTVDGKPMLWVCIGDGANSNMYFWSKDFGVTWNKVSARSYAPIQATDIVPLRNCVLFTSDARIVGAVRYNRPVTGTHAGQDLSFDTPLLLFEGWGKDNSSEVPIASTPAIDYENSLAYFGWDIAGNCATGNTVNDTLLKGQVYATDGYNFFEIYKHSSVVTGRGVRATLIDGSDIVARIDDVGAVRFNESMWN